MRIPRPRKLWRFPTISGTDQRAATKRYHAAYTGKADQEGYIANRRVAKARPGAASGRLREVSK